MKLISGIGPSAPDLALRQLLSDVMRNCRKSRAEIAIELSNRVGRPISASILNDYTATTKNAARFPAAYIRDFCEITGDDKLQRFVIGGRLLDLLAIGESELSIARNVTTKRTNLERLLSSRKESN